MSDYSRPSTHNASGATLEDLGLRIARSIPSEQRGFRRRLQSIRKAQRAGRPFDRNLGRLRADVDLSCERFAARVANAPVIRFEQDLPILARREEIAAAIGTHRVIVVCGETGSGKSTQLPKICLAAGRGIAGLIGHTQPRRIAARSVAARIAEEIGSPLGEAVGYKVRFHDRTKPETYVKVMTDGILVAETQSDPQLKKYDTIIIDEAHERSLNIDFLLGYLNQLIASRPELRVIVTSATIDAERFADYFGSHAGPAPIIEVSGRGYPVVVRYAPVGEDEPDDDTARCVARAVDGLLCEGQGDVLVFLPTERDIRDTAQVLRGRVGRQVEILPLYARLSAAEQNRVFQPHAARRVVLATNVAESSITVSGIRYVVDTGTARISRYAPRSKVERLPIEVVSQASANQRAGRCGRIGPGICVRLYSEEDFQSRDAYTTPEIRRMNLAAVILKMLALEQGPVENFPFLDRPRPDAVRDGYKTLFELGAIDADRKLTDVGRQLSELPVDPRIGRMILAAREENCLSEILIIAAALEVQDPRERPVDKQSAADEAHSKWRDERSDFLGILKLWDDYHGWKADLSRNRLRKQCQRNFLSYPRMREWQDVHRQLLDLVKQGKFSLQPRRDAYAGVHRSLLAGLLSSVAMKESAYEYLGGDAQKFFLWPGAGPFEQRPKWVIAAELVETSKRFLRCVGRIDPTWIEPLAGHLVERKYLHPFWSRKRESVLATERVLLFGLPVGHRRGVPFGPVDPRIARQIFIREALAQDQIDTPLGFLRQNTALLHRISSEAARTRDRRLVLDEASLRAFYDTRLPLLVYDVASLRRALKTDADLETRLVMHREDLIGDTRPAENAERFPDSIRIDEQRLVVDYRFAQGAADDGLTLSVPADLLQTIDDDHLGWLVPGMLAEKIAGLIRTLPKPIRRQLVPAPDTARRVADRIEFGVGRFLPTIARELAAEAGTPIPPESFQADQLPDYLRFNVRVVDEQGQTLAEGRDLTAIRTRLGGTSHVVEGEIHDAHWRREGILRWDFGLLPPRVEVARGTFRLTGFPALIDRVESVELRLLTSEHEALHATAAGVRRLFLLGHPAVVAEQIDWWPDLDRLERLAAVLPRGGPFREQLAAAIADRALAQSGDLPRDPPAFESLCQEAVARIPAAVQDVARVVGPLVERYAEAHALLAQWRTILPPECEQDIARQLAELVHGDFLVDVPWTWLKHYPRFLQAIALRIDKIRSGNADRDRRLLAQLRPFLDAYWQAVEQREGTHHEHLEEFRWMIEECRVSLFAQELGTSIKISPRRLERFWANI